MTFRFTGADGRMVDTETLTSGMIGKEVKLEFSSDWDNLKKTAVFMAGAVTRDVVDVSNVAVIPAEVLATPLQRLYVGVYGVSKDGKKATPTIRAEGPWILPGANPSGDESADPALPVWAHLDQRVTKLEENETDNGGSDPGQSVTDAVRYTAQTLTDEQKAQARANIGAQADVGTAEVETLETVPIVYDSKNNNGGGGWIDTATFEYTEGAVGANYGPIVVKQSTLAGGLLRVDWDTNVAKAMDLSMYLFDSGGNPYLLAGKLLGGTAEKWSGELYEPTYGEPDTYDSTGFAVAPFSVQIPAGCTCMCWMRWVPGNGAKSPDGSIADATAFQNWVLGGGMTFTVEKAFSGYVEKDFGTANANRYLVTDENGNVTVGSIVGAEEANTDIPDYITAEVTSVANTLKAVQEAHPKSATFAFLTDHHFHYNSEHLVRHNFHAIDEIAKTCRVEFAAYGGDNIAENGNGAVALNKVKYFGNILRDYSIRTAVAMGNHDDNSLAGYQSDTGKYLVDYTVPQSQFYAHMYRQNENVFNIDMDANRNKLYFYIDLPSQQIRVIFLNVIDIPILDDGSGGLVYTGIHDSGYSNEQLNWVVSDALNFSDKKHPEQWDVITVQHYVDCPNLGTFSGQTAGCFVDQAHGGEAMYNIFKAYKDRTAYSSVIAEGDFAHDVSCDFTDAKAGLICRISGHTHADRHILYDGVLYLSTMAAGLNGAGLAQGTDGITYSKTPDTAEESAFDFLTFDKDTKTIHATRFGAGVDRVISWESGEMEDDGNLFDYGTRTDWEYRDGTSMADESKWVSFSVNEAEGYIRCNDQGGSAGVFFVSKRFVNDKGTYTLSAVFTAENEAKTANAKFYLRLFDAAGNAITTGMSGWTYKTYYPAFVHGNDGEVGAKNLSFTLPENAATFQIGFVFDVAEDNDGYVRISDIMLTAES